MFRCEYPGCTSEYTSQFAAAECEEQDRIDDTNTRQWFSGYNPHRKD